jgi:hypothetical protein
MICLAGYSFFVAGADSHLAARVLTLCRDWNLYFDIHQLSSTTVTVGVHSKRCIYIKKKKQYRNDFFQINYLLTRN